MYEFQTSPIEVKNQGGENFAYVSLETGAYHSKQNESGVKPENDSDGEKTPAHRIQISVWEANDNETCSEECEQEKKRFSTIEEQDTEMALESKELEEQPMNTEPKEDGETKDERL